MTDRAFEPSARTPEDIAAPDKRPNRFDKYDPDINPGWTPPAAPRQPNRFDKYDPYPGDPVAGAVQSPGDSSTLGAFGRSAARSAVPAIGSLPAIGAGAFYGGEIGALAARWRRSRCRSAR